MASHLRLSFFSQKIEAAKIWFFWKFPQHVFMTGMFRMSVPLVRKVGESCLRSSAYDPFATPELAQNILVSPNIPQKVDPLF